MSKKNIFLLVAIFLIVMLFIGVIYQRNISERYVLRVYRNETSNGVMRVTDEFVADSWWELRHTTYDKDKSQRLIDMAGDLEWKDDNFHEGQQSDEKLMISQGGLVHLHWDIFINSQESIAYIYSNAGVTEVDLEEYVLLIYGEELLQVYMDSYMDK